MSAGAAMDTAEATSRERRILLQCPAEGVGREAGQGFADLLCEAVARGLTESRQAAVTRAGSDAGSAGDAVGWVRIHLRIVGESQADASASWGTFRDGRFVETGRSESLQAGALDAPLNPGTAKLLADALVARVAGP